MLTRPATFCLLAMSAFFLAWTARQAGVRFPGQADQPIGLRSGVAPDDRLTAHIDASDLTTAIRAYCDITGRQVWPDSRPILEKLDAQVGGRLARFGFYTPAPKADSGLSLHRDGLLRAEEVKERIEQVFSRAGLKAVPRGNRYFELVPK